MPNFGSIAHLIELAIQGERFTERFYHRLAAKFSHYPEIARFWEQYAVEENGHARWLENLRIRADRNRLNETADTEILQQAESAINKPIEQWLSNIKTLQDAYEVANELEHSETNTVFEFLISYFTEDPETAAFLRTQLNDHVGRLMIDFPSRVGTGTLRRGITIDTE